MRTKKTVVVLVSGKAGSGKSTIAEKLAERISLIDGMDVMLYGFADPIKHIAKAFFGWDGQKDDRGRRLLQQIGAVGREYDQDIWVKHFLNQLDKRSGIFPKNFAFISDWRFPNELSYLQKNPLLDVVTIRVFGRGGLEGTNASDVSENSLPEISHEYLSGDETVVGTIDALVGYDFAVENSGDLQLLEHKLDLIVGQIKKQYVLE